MTLSYYAKNYLKLFDSEGKPRPLRDHEIEFLKMVEVAQEMGMDLKQVYMREKYHWVLVSKTNNE